MIFHHAAVASFVLMASSVISSVDGFAGYSSSLNRPSGSSYTGSKSLYSVVPSEKTEQGHLISPDDISDDDIPLLFEQHVQKTYG
jgi:hypothetical protein